MKVKTTGGEQYMKIKDIKNLVSGKVCIYRDDDFEELWEGYANNIPSEYLDLKIILLWARCEGIIEVCIKEEGEKADDRKSNAV